MLPLTEVVYFSAIISRSNSRADIDAHSYLGALPENSHPIVSTQQFGILRAMKIKREKRHSLRDIYPTKYYSDEGFVETKLEINEDDLPEIIEYYLRDHAEFDFDEVEIVNNRPMNIWLYAKCRNYVDPDEPGVDLDNAEVEVKGAYDANPTRRL